MGLFAATMRACIAEGFTLVREQPIIALLVGRLRVGGVLVSSLGHSGTIACAVPYSVYMYWITESVFFFSCLSGVLNAKYSGMRCGRTMPCFIR